MSQETPSSRKVVRRSAFITLTLICIILATLVAGMVPALINYRTIISNKDNEIASLNSTQANFLSVFKQYLADLNRYKTLFSQTKTWLKDNTTYYDAQITNLQKIISLQDMTLLYNDSVVAPYSQRPAVWNNIPSCAPDLGINLEGHPVPIEYAGYLAVSIVSSSSNSTSIYVDYSSNQLYYNNTVNTGLSGTAYFPILPTTNLNINLLNTDSTNLNITRAIIMYVY